MPSPTTTCSVCGETVLKSQTYHVGDGKRACKKHEGVNEKAEAAQKAIAAEKQKKEEQEAAARRKWSEEHQPLES